MQVITKAVLTILGLSAILNLSQYVSTAIRARPDSSAVRAFLFLLVLIILIALIAYLLIFKNGRLARKMAGPGEQLNPENEALWLVASLRIVAIFYGLILLSTSIPTILNIVVSPLCVRSLINEIFTFKTFPKSLIFTASQWSSMIYNSLKALLAVYLLCGWPQFIRFQLNIYKAELPPDQNQYIEGIENE
jgi:hypothetical protein